MSKPNISDTAFLVNYHRAKHERISLDVYSKYWVTKKSISLSKKLSKEVYKNDDIEICLRSRFFLENLRCFLARNPQAVVVNVGAGFTSYPYLLEPARFIEIDLPHITTYKANKIKMLVKKGKLPKRNVEFISADLQNKKDLKILEQKLSGIILKEKSFFILEGITYYVEKKYLQQLLHIINNLQSSGCELAVEFWSPDIQGLPVFKRLVQYAKRHLNYEPRQWHLYDIGFFAGATGYEVVEFTSTGRLEKFMGRKCLLCDEHNNLLTKMAILRK